MTTDTAHVEALVEIWADWARRDTSGLGYPQRSTTHRAMEQKRTGAIWGEGKVPQPKDDSGRRAPGQHTINMPLDVERVEVAMTTMPIRLQRAIWLRYVCHWMNDGQRASILSRDTGDRVSKRDFGRVVQTGMAYLMGALDTHAGYEEMMRA